MRRLIRFIIGSTHDRILKVARTVADLDGAEGVAATHVAEPMQYSSLDRNC
jgi:magnesium chelatase family protein